MRGRGQPPARARAARLCARPTGSEGADVGLDELPDYLPLMLEVAANVPGASALLAAERRSLERLQQSLEEAGSPFHLVVEAVLAAFLRRVARPRGGGRRTAGTAALRRAAARRGCTVNAHDAWQLFDLVILPYLALTIFVLGHVWRYRFDRFGWTSRSSQLYERPLLLIGGPLFHYGALMAIGGHALGLLLPESWTKAIGIHESAYALLSKVAGTTAVVLVIIGLAVLTYRRLAATACGRSPASPTMWPSACCGSLSCSASS